MTHYRLEQTGDVDIEFDGELLAEVSNYDTAGPDRWQIVLVYRTTTDKWIVQRRGMTSKPGEVNRSTVRVCSNTNQVRKAITFTDTRDGEKRSYITNVCYDAVSAAAERDPRLEDALVTRV